MARPAAAFNTERADMRSENSTKQSELNILEKNNNNKSKYDTNDLKQFTAQRIYIRIKTIILFYIFHLKVRNM